MKKLFWILAAAAVAAIGVLTPHISLAGTVRTATEPWVTNKVAQAAADVLGDAEDYTDAGVSNLGVRVEAEIGTNTAAIAENRIQIATNTHAIAENRIQIATNAADIVTLKTGKQDAISDLETIRSGAALGATALQEHQSLTNYFAKGESDGRYLQSYTETDPTIYDWAKAATRPSYTLNDVCPDTENWLGVPGTTAGGKSIKVLAKTVNGVIEGGVTVTGSSNNDNNVTKYRYGGVSVKRNGTNTDYLWDTTSASGIVRRAELAPFITSETDPTIYSWAKAATKPSYSYSEISGTPDLDEFATTNQLEASDRLIIDLISSTNVLLTVTNVASQVEIPSASIQYATTNGLETVWNELDRHTATLNAAKAYSDTSISNSAANLTTQINTKANKSWSQYTSGLGADAPAGVTWISTPETVIAGGYEYTKTITSRGNIWVLTSNGLHLGQGGAVTNFFQIASADGTPIIRIDKTDAQLVTVDASGIEVIENSNTVLVPIALSSNTHPYARVSTNLIENATTWYKEDENGMPAGSPATVSWSGTSGAWVCTADFGQCAEGYLFFEFLQPGETKIVNCGLTDLSNGMIYNGVKYYPVDENGELKFKRQSP